MTSITHNFVSAKSDGGDTSVVRPSDWNAEHVVSGLGAGISILGYDTIGGSWETVTASRVLAKKISVPSAGVIVGLGTYVQATVSDSVGAGFSTALYSDNAGTPQYVIGRPSHALGDSLLMDTTSGGGGVSNPRWLWTSVSFHVPSAGDYWVAIMPGDTSDGLQLAYDTGGADRYYGTGGNWFADWGFYSPTTTSNRYSIAVAFVATANSGDTVGFAHSYVGRNAIGASYETPTTTRVVMKKITLSTASILVHIEANIKMTADVAGGQLQAFLFDDNGSGTAPLHYLGSWATVRDMVLEQSTTGPRDARWVGVPCGRFCTSGIYWIGWALTDADVQIAYDTGGSDPYFSPGTSPNPQIGDWGLWSSTDSTRNYSLRASVIEAAGSSLGTIDSSNVTFPLDAVSGSANSRDDDFGDGPSIDGKWTLYGNSLAVSEENVSPYLGLLHLSRTDTGNKLSIYGQSLPSLPCTMYAKVKATTYRGNYSRGGGLVLLPSSPSDSSAAVYLGPLFESSRVTQAVKYSDLSTYSSTIFSHSVTIGQLGIWLKMVINSSTSIDLYYSVDGTFWYTGTTGYNPGFTPSVGGIGMSPEGVTVEAAFAWFAVR